MGGPTGWWTGETSAPPSDAVESSWLDIVEATPDPRGTFWLTEPQAAKLILRVQSAGDRSDSHLMEVLSSMLSGESQPEREQA